VLIRRAPCVPVFPYTTLFRSRPGSWAPTSPSLGRSPCRGQGRTPTTSVSTVSTPRLLANLGRCRLTTPSQSPRMVAFPVLTTTRSEEHTSELQSRFDLVCRLL